MVTSERTPRRPFVALPYPWYFACALFVVGGYFLGSSQSELSPSRSLHESAENEEESEENESVLALTVTVCIALVLILCTVAFETIKEYLEEQVNAEMGIILEKLNGELTVLGFLAMIMFICTTTGYFEILSENLFGKEEELLEYMESVHFSIFFIMIFFVFQVVVLVKEAEKLEEEWSALDQLCRLDPNDVTTAASLRKAHKKRLFRGNSFSTLLNSVAEAKEDEVIFKALRSEFILERGIEAPFKPAPEEKRIEDDFDFGRYLSISLTHLLTHVVDVRIATWLLFIVGTILFYGLALLLEGNIEVLAWIWVGCGWGVFIFNIVFEHHLIRLRNIFIPKDTLQTLSSEGSIAIETSSLLGTDETGHLPKWCDVDLEHFMGVQRPWFVRMLVGGKPNRLQVSFWLDRRGQHFYLIIMQMNLIFLGVYASLTLQVFLPMLYNTYGLLLLTLYVVLAIVPGIMITFQKKRLIATLALVCSIGSFRKPQIVSDVLREKKTTRAVRTFIVIYKMREFAASVSTASSGNSIPHPIARPLIQPKDFRSSFSTLQLEEVSKMFTTMDADGSGFLTSDEFGALLGRMGAHFAPEALKAVVAQLDKDGDGQVAREEFLQWYTEQILSEHSSPHEQAKKLFELFDDDSNGEITIGEFKDKLDALNLDFSIDDVGAIVNELDKDRSGSVSLEEFETLFVKYYPRELEAAHEGHSHW